MWLLGCCEWFLRRCYRVDKVFWVVCRVLQEFLGWWALICGFYGDVSAAMWFLMCYELLGCFCSFLGGL